MSEALSIPTEYVPTSLGVDEDGAVVLGSTNGVANNALVYDKDEEDSVPFLKYVDADKDFRVKGKMTINAEKVITGTTSSANADTETITTTKTYNVADHVINATSSITLNAENVLLAGNALNPTDDNAAVPKSYVDNYSQGVIVYEPVDRKSTENISGTYDNGANGVGATLTINSRLALDGYTYLDGDVNTRVLLADQTDNTENGIYYISSISDVTTVLTRTTDMDGSPNYEMRTGIYVNVTNGDDNEATGWVLSTKQSSLANPPVISLTNGSLEPIVWYQIRGSSGNEEAIVGSVIVQTEYIVSGTTVNPITTYSSIEISNENTDYTLANGVSGTLKEIHSNKLEDVYIRCDNQTIFLNPNNPSVHLIFTTKWERLTGTSTIRYQQGSKLVGSGYIGQQRQGDSVDLSADGNTLAIGGITYEDTGGTWIFVRSGTTWAQQGDALVGTGGSGTQYQGSSVSLSADGNTLAVGGSISDSVGATWIFVRSGTTWTQQGSKLVGTGGSGGSQGSSVALSANGNTLAIGAPGDSASAGAVWIFTRSGTTWTQQGSKLVGTGGAGTSQGRGDSVSLSADGNTLAVGGSYDNSSIGAVWIFTRSGTTWTQQGSKLVGTGYISTPRQGIDISLSANGNVLAVGGYKDNTDIGAVWIFTRSDTTWTQQGSKLIGTGYVGTPNLGYSVALSAKGDILAIGGYTDDSNEGAVWMFTQFDNTWTQQGDKLTVSGNTEPSKHSSGLSISSDGTTLATGGYEDDNRVGATWIFT